MEEKYVKKIFLLLNFPIAFFIFLCYYNYVELSTIWK